MSSFDPTECQAAVSQLTPRQKQVLAGIGTGRPRKQVADDLKMSPGTLRTHCESIFRRLNIHSAPEAVRVAVTAGLV